MFGVGSAFHLYMMESEGMEDQVTTRRARLKAAEKEVKALRPDCFNDVCRIIYNHGVDAASLTDAEWAMFNF